jgi:trimeric autotransporter adhesin
MKGSGAEGTIQNYTFVGKPNNGLIDSNTVAADQLLLTGNPYPSALDATAFINDNINSIDGTLYFWEHYDTNTTHILRDYQGGYAERNLVGGLPPVAPSLISGLGSSTRIPGQFIPIGQGFLVIGKNGFGGNVLFNNSQRAFHKEDETNVSNVMFKTKVNSKTKNTDNNYNDSVSKDTIMKIRLGFNSSNMYHRQVLMGFMNEKASDGMDYGYDALNIDNFPNDMYFLNNENQLVIQGVGYFDAESSYPIGVKTTNEGTVSFIIDSLENFDSRQAVYIYDNLTHTYHNIRNGKFEIQMPIGETNSRFSLRFKDKSLKTNQNSISEAIQIHLQKNNVLIIDNHILEVKLEKISLYNLLGQTIKTWKIENQEQQIFQIPITNVSSGIYITKLFTSKGELNNKIIIP